MNGTRRFSRNKTRVIAYFGCQEVTVMKKAGKVLTVMLLLTLLAGCNPAHAVEIDDGSGIRTENLPAKPWEQEWILRDKVAGDREKPDGITMELYHAINSFRQENSVKALAWTDSLRSVPLSV